MPPINPDRVRQIAHEEGLDVLIASSPANVQYLTGYNTAMLLLQPSPQVWAIYERSSECAALVLPSIRLPASLEADLGVELVPYGKSPFLFGAEAEPGLAAELSARLEAAAPTPLAGLGVAMRRLGVAAGRVGVDEGRMTPSSWAELVAALPSCKVQPAGSLWLRMRSIKARAEVDRLAEAVHLLEEAVEETLPDILAGRSEVEANLALRSRLALRGGFYGAGSICIGPRAGAVLPASNRTVAHPGDIVKWDVAATFDNYWADTARTASVGAPKQGHEKAFEAVRASHTAVLEALRPGVKASHLYRIGREAMERAGVSAPLMHVGHGIGLDLYEPPLLSPSDGTPLAEGMVLNVENPCFEVGVAAMTIEDTVVVTRDGWDLLTRCSGEFRRL